MACQKVDVEGMFIQDESVNQRFVQSENWNKGHPCREVVVPTDNYSILSVADIHVGDTKNLKRFLTLAKTTDVAAVVMAGDLTNGHDSEYEEFKRSLPSQDSLSSFLLAGNHDLNYKGWNQFSALFGSSTYFFTIVTPVAKDLYICLESGSATLGNKQMDWLRNILQLSRPEYRRCIVFTHTNFYRFRHTESTTPLAEEAAALLDLFARSKVDLVIQGHDHKKSDATLGITKYLVMEALANGSDNGGYLKLNFNRGVIDYAFMNLSNDNASY